MYVFQGRNVGALLPNVLQMLNDHGCRRESRAGDVVMFPMPVTTMYHQPRERVLYYPERDANPFFHLIESLWMLCGYNDVESIARYNNNIRNFSDDGVTFHGAYGHRWRKNFSVDQLHLIANILRDDPNDRRCVLGMWSPSEDLGVPVKDVPCNTHIYFAVSLDGKLDMTVCNRSNDLIWGAYGANAVHMSVLQEWMAAAVGVEVGTYWQMSNNLHAYVEVMESMEALMNYAEDPMVPITKTPDPYRDGTVEPFPLVNVDPILWLSEADMLLSEGGGMGFTDPFFKRVAIPMVQAWEVYKRESKPHNYSAAIDLIEDSMADCDWKIACKEWLKRRWLKFLNANDDGVNYENN